MDLKVPITLTEFNQMTNKWIDFIIKFQEKKQEARDQFERERQKEIEQRQKAEEQRQRAAQQAEARKMKYKRM